MGRVTKWQNAGTARGGTAELSHGCCGVDWKLDDDGRRTVYQYDDQKRGVSETTTLGDRVETTRTEYSGLTTSQYRELPRARAFRWGIPCARWFGPGMPSCLPNSPPSGRTTPPDARRR